MAKVQRPKTADQSKAQNPDFREFLKDYEQEALHKIYGIKTAPRDREPPMTMILSWNQDENDHWNFKKNKHAIEEATELEKINKKINKTSTPWVTENRDNYRKFIYSEGQKQPVFYELYDSEIKDIPGLVPSPSKTKHLRRNPGDPELRNVSTYQNDYVHFTKQRPVEERLALDSTKDLKKRQVNKGKVEKGEKDKRKSSALIKEEAKKELVAKLTKDSRLLPNSSFVTYFAKPAFCNYGSGNLKPAIGGHLYGDYMQTHNVNPHSGKNHPDFRQSYKGALEKSQASGTKEPHVPLKVVHKEKLCNHKSKGNVAYMPEENNYQSKSLRKPNLEKSIRVVKEGDLNPAVTVPKKPKQNTKKNLKAVNGNEETLRKEHRGDAKDEAVDTLKSAKEDLKHTASFGEEFHKKDENEEDGEKNSKNDKVEISLCEYQEYLKLKHSKANQKQNQRAKRSFAQPAGVKVVKDDSVKDIFDQWGTLLKNDWQAEEL